MTPRYLKGLLTGQTLYIKALSFSCSFMTIAPSSLVQATINLPDLYPSLTAAFSVTNETHSLRGHSAEMLGLPFKVKNHFLSPFILLNHRAEV